MENFLIGLLAVSVVLTPALVSLLSPSEAEELDAMENDAPAWV